MDRLSSTDKILCAIYAAIALVALVGTQIALFQHLNEYDGNKLTGFVSDSLANPAAVFAFIDLIAVAVAALVFMIVEGRRLAISHLWIYVALTFVVAISVALPAFLIARQVRLAGGSDAVTA